MTKHTDDAARPEEITTTDPTPRRTPRVLLMIAMASVLAVTPMVTGIPQISALATPHPVKSQRHEVAFVASSVASLRVAKGATRSVESTLGAPDPISTARAAGVTPTQDVAGDLAVVGVTWPKDAVSAGDSFQIRTMTGTTWSMWETLDADQGDGPDPAEAAHATGGTSPYVVTGASKFEVRSLTTDVTAPSVARVQVVDPGTSSADDLRAPPGAAEAAVTKPTIYTRAQWGADESLRRAAPSYGQVQLAFVHHTVSSNSYTSSQVPAMIRGIYAYHVQSEGWNDIGYNFLIDRFGRTWEGRYGGMDRAVVGAQTLNYNAVSTGVSAIGNFDVAGVPQAVTDGLKRLLAWKLTVHGVPVTGTVVANGKSFQRISGHRDGFQTACPGKYLYAKLPEIRTGAAAIVNAKPPAPVTPAAPNPRDVDRNGAPDALSYTTSAAGTSITGSVSLLASSPASPVRPGVAIGAGWNGLRNASVSPDLTGDGKADIVAQDPTANRLRIYRGDGSGSFAGLIQLGIGWNAMTRIIAAHDRNGDGRNDILATNTKGDLIFYAGDGAGSLTRARTIGQGWNSVKSLTAAGDLNHDRITDLLATRLSDGAEMMYPGRSDGSVGAGVVWGSGWGAFSAVVGGSDLDGDAYSDVYARLGGGMTSYSTDNTGHLVRYTRWGSGWADLTQLSTGADWNGDGIADLMAVNSKVSSGSLIFYAGTGKRDFTTRLGGLPSVGGADHVRLVGDTNGDGYVDVVARIRTSGNLVILLGRAGSTFASPVTIGSGWNGLTLIEAAGDFDNDGVPDLLARDSGGALLVYPFRSDLTFKPALSIGSGFQGMQSVVGVGRINGDAYVDVIALRASDHALILFAGNGSGGLRSAVVLKTGQNDLSQLIGVGDYNGDTRADLLARSAAGSLWIYPGNGAGALAGRQPVRGGEGTGHVLG